MPTDHDERNPDDRETSGGQPQERPEERPAAGIVKPEDYPDKASGKDLTP